MMFVIQQLMFLYKCSSNNICYFNETIFLIHDYKVLIVLGALSTQVYPKLYVWYTYGKMGMFSTQKKKQHSN